MPSGLLVGAYERDNFGDILFLNRARHYLGDRAALATAPAGGNSSEVGGESVVAYGGPLAGDPVPFVWVVGGATGSTTVAGALSMAGDATATDPGLPDYASPYLPRMSRYSATTNAKYIVNSVGVAGVGRLTGRRRIEVEAALREATFLSVRDAASARYLASRRIPHHLAPDFVQTLPLHVQARSLERDVALIQLKSRLIRGIGVEALASALADMSELRPFRLRFFSAGEAPGHDSTELLNAVADAYRKRSGRLAEVSTQRTAEDKAAEIASAGLWIGTSLHGFIVSSAYEVPRVGLLIDKVRTYARSWNIDMPTKVDIPDLGAAIASALQTSAGVMAADAERLAVAADKNARRIIAHLDAPSSDLDREGSAARVQRALDRVSPITEFVESSTLLGRRAVSAARQSLSKRT